MQIEVKDVGLAVNAKAFCKIAFLEDHYSQLPFSIGRSKKPNPKKVRELLKTIKESIDSLRWELDRIPESEVKVSFNGEKTIIL